MLNKEQIKMCEKIIKNSTEIKQSFVAIEEMAELQQAISKVHRASTIPAIDHIAEEIADVYIILEQLKIMFGIDNTEIEEQIEFKLQRELKRTENKNS
ncbi:hypothetical protein ACTQ4P_05450 [Clostridium sporogenes]|uniref:hypothetical protein n=1 Tax=Clostridium sporogenes TaxID=1509 RepID=UPI002904FFDE|nr:hypothetical protein [Clostridium botulinum]